MVACNTPVQTRSWIICDGDIDPEWIESLNSVLDDNRLLTLPNGERIQFANNVNFVFESHDLTHASPATVRFGPVCVCVCVCVCVWISRITRSGSKSSGQSRMGKREMYR